MAAAHDEASAEEAGKAYYASSRHEGRELHAILEGGTAERKRQSDKYGEQLRAVLGAENEAMHKLQRNAKLRLAFAKGMREAGGEAQ
jgi:hypothetical protein